VSRSALIFVATAALALLGCKPSPRPQEPMIGMRFLPHGADNPVGFGSSLAGRVELQAACVTAIDSYVGDRLPGVRFFVVRFPVRRTPDGEPCNAASSRTVSRRGTLCVLSWREDEAGLHVENIPWEVDHLLSATGDDGLYHRVRSDDFFTTVGRTFEVR
jgi:hypothetical protein